MPVSYNGVAVPANGARISYSGGRYQVPDNPIIPFIEGDGTGRDIWRASSRVFDAAVEKAYNGTRRVVWYEVFAGLIPPPDSRRICFLPPLSISLFRNSINLAASGVPCSHSMPA